MWDISLSTQIRSRSSGPASARFVHRRRATRGLVEKSRAWGGGMWTDGPRGADPGHLPVVRPLAGGKSIEMQIFRKFL